MIRVSQPELLDQPGVDPREISDSLADLGTVNRLFGGIATSFSLFDRANGGCEARQISILDVGAGSGDVPRAVARRFRSRGIRVAVTLYDQHANHLPELDGSDPDLHTVTGDALDLPFADNSFDYVSSSLFAHHLEPEVLCQFAAQALRVARRAVIINDLVRSPLHLAGIHLWRPFFRTRISYLDGLTSVRRAYTVSEMRELLSPLGRVEVTRHFFFRMGVILWKSEAPPKGGAAR